MSLSKKKRIISRDVSRRLMRLLDMEYRPSEIANELAVNVKTVYAWLNEGAPCRQDKKKRYWIHGLSFVEWAWNVGRKKQSDNKPPMKESEAYCFTCRRVVEYKRIKQVDRIVYGVCPAGHKVTRIVRIKG